MNADLIARESHVFLEEIASYEEPRLSLPHVPSVAELAKASPKNIRTDMPQAKAPTKPKGHISDNPIGHAKSAGTSGSRREAILTVLRSKGPSRIKEVSTIVRDISEKTIQRELQALTAEGVIKKEGERRWTTYSL
jgi:DNA-binding transcriptional ArsR family regulator